MRIKHKSPYWRGQPRAGSTRTRKNVFLWWPVKALAWPSATDETRWLMRVTTLEIFVVPSYPVGGPGHWAIIRFLDDE